MCEFHTYISPPFPQRVCGSTATIHRDAFCVLLPVSVNNVMYC